MSLKEVAGGWAGHPAPKDGDKVQFEVDSDFPVVVEVPSGWLLQALTTKCTIVQPWPAQIIIAIDKPVKLKLSYTNFGLRKSFFGYCSPSEGEQQYGPFTIQDAFQKVKR